MSSTSRRMRLPRVPNRLRGSKGMGIIATKCGNDSVFSFTKIFFVILILSIFLYMTIQLTKKKFDRKYVIALYVILIVAFVGVIVKNFPIPSPYIQILNAIFLIGPIVASVVISILMSRDKF